MLTVIVFSQPRPIVLIPRGVIVGWMVLSALRAVTVPISRIVMGTWVLDWLIVHLGSHPFVMLWATQLWTRPLQAASYVLCGWIVAKTHRQSAEIILATFMATVLVRFAIATAQYFAVQHRIYDHVAHPEIEITFMALPLLILVGGSLAQQRRAAA